MSGLPELNHPAFHKAKAKLERMGLMVVSPADLEGQRGEMSYLEKLRDDLKHLLTCDAIYLMKNWHLSNGAKLEAFVASNLDFRIIYEE